IRISIIGADGTTVVTSADTTLGGNDLNFNRYDLTQVFETNPIGKFVRIEAIDVDSLFPLRLALAEVEVFGPAPVIEELAGDYNDDGKVDAADYAMWRDKLGSGTSLANDNNLGTPVGSGHYSLWKSNFGETLMGTGGATPQNVPEPTSMWLLLSLAGIGL